MKFLLILFVFMNVALSSYASCYTGFACSVDSLKEEQIKQHKEFSEKLNNYFSRKVNQDFFFLRKPSLVAYSDLFLFKRVV